MKLELQHVTDEVGKSKYYIRKDGYLLEAFVDEGEARAYFTDVVANIDKAGCTILETVEI